MIVAQVTSMVCCRDIQSLDEFANRLRIDIERYPQDYPDHVVQCLRTVFQALRQQMHVGGRS